MVTPTRREKQRRRTSKHARKKRHFLVLGKLRELKEQGASVSKAIRQLQGVPVVELQRMDDSAMSNRQEHRNYHAGYPHRSWKSFGRRRQLDDVWMPNYDDDDHSNRNDRWNDYTRCNREMYRSVYPEYPRNYSRPNSHINYHYNQYGSQNYTYKRSYYPSSSWRAESNYPSRSRPQGYYPRGRTPVATSTVTSENSQQARILVECTSKKPTVEETTSLSDKTIPGLPCADKQVVPEKSNSSEIVQPDKPSTESNSSAPLNTMLSLDPLSNPEFNLVVTNLENCIASSADAAKKDGDGHMSGVVEIEVEIAPYPEEADCVDSDTETVVYFEQSEMADNELTVDQINTSSSFLNSEESTQTMFDTRSCQSPNISVKRKSEDSFASKLKVSKTGDNEKTESINNFNDKLSTDTFAKYFHTTQSKVVDDISTDIETSRHQEKGVTKVDGIVNSEKLQDVVQTCRITKRRKTVHETLSRDEQVASNHRQDVVQRSRISKRRKTVHDTESKNQRAESNHDQFERSNSLPLRITRSKSHELQLECESLPDKYREHTKPTKSKQPRPTSSTRRSSVARRMSCYSTDDESDISSISYLSSASESKKKRKRPKQTSKPKGVPTIPCKVRDPILQTPPGINSSQPIQNNTSDMKAKLVRYDEYQKTASAERTSQKDRFDHLFGAHSDNEEITIRWSPKPENLTWSPQLDSSIFESDQDIDDLSASTTSKSCKEKIEETIPKKDHSYGNLRTMPDDKSDKVEIKKKHYRLSLIQEEGCSKKLGSRRASLSHNSTGKQESEKTNEPRRLSLGHGSNLIVERRRSLTPLTNILPQNDRINTVKADIRALREVSGNHADDIKKSQPRRSSVTQNNGEKKPEQKTILNGHNNNNVSKQNLTKIESRRRSSISYASIADLEQDTKSNTEETNNKQKKKEDENENKRPCIKQRQPLIDLKHAAANHIQDLTWESIIHLECVHPELKSAHHCQHPRKIKPHDIVLMPIVTVYDKFTTVQQLRTTDSQPGSSAEPTVRSAEDVIDLCDSDDEQIKDIISINSLMRTVLDEKSEAKAPSEEVASSSTEFCTQHSEVGSSSATAVSTEIPISIQNRTTTNSSLPSSVVKLNCNNTAAELGNQHSAVALSAVNVAPTEMPLTVQNNNTTMVSVTQNEPDLTVTLIDPRSSNASNMSLSHRSSSTTITPVIATSSDISTNSLAQLANMSQIQGLPTQQAPSTLLFTSEPEVAPASRSSFNTRQVENVPPTVENIVPILHNILGTQTVASGYNVPPVQRLRLTLVRSEDFANIWGVKILLYSLMERSIHQLLSHYSSQCKFSREDVAKEFRFMIESVPQSLNDLACRLFNYLKTHEITNFSVKGLVHDICICSKTRCNYRTHPIGILKLLVQIVNEWNVGNNEGFSSTFAWTVLQEWQRQYNAAIVRQNATNAQQRSATGIQNHNQTAQRGVPPQAPMRMTTSTVENNARQNNQNQMTATQNMKFLSQCEDYRRLSKEISNMLARQQCRQLLTNTMAQNVQQCHGRGSAGMQRQSVDASNIPVSVLRRRAQQRPIASGIQLPTTHVSSSQASGMAQNRQSALQQINSISNQSVVPEIPVRANVNWIPNKNVGQAGNASHFFTPSVPVTQHSSSIPLTQHTPSVPLTQHTSSVPVTQHTSSVPVTQHTSSVPLTQHTSSVPVTQHTSSVPLNQYTPSVLPLTQHTLPVPPLPQHHLPVPSLIQHPQLLSLLRQPPEQPTQLPQPQTTRTFNPFPNDEFRIRLPLMEPLKSMAPTPTTTTAPTSTSAQVGASNAGETAVKDEADKNEPSDVIDVDEWFDKRICDDEVECLNPEYFLTVHIKHDIDQLIKPDVDCDPNANNAGTVQGQQILQNPAPPRIASVDSGFSSPPTQFEHLDILSGERMCICSQKAELVCKCRLAIYCSKKCQLVDWPNHQPHCVRALSNLPETH